MGKQTKIEPDSEENLDKSSEELEGGANEKKKPKKTKKSKVDPAVVAR